ncbi:MAG TPA: Mur ligase family protein [Nevskiaceae bacterium]|nr:Mur ligase family protein [Nevskiaceae bacterium]
MQSQQRNLSLSSVLRGFASLYSWRYPAAIVAMLHRAGYRPGTYLRYYWQTNTFAADTQAITSYSSLAQTLLRLVTLGSLFQIGLGLWLIMQWREHGLVGGWQFGMALLISYPIVWAHVLAVAVWLKPLAHPKALGKTVVAGLLEAQVTRLRKRNKFSVVAVAGSVGKTSTKIAIAKTLGVSRRVQWQEGNYNDRLTVPLIFFGQSEPGIYNIPAWIKILLQNELALRRPYPYAVVVVELGPDHPGQIKAFAYLKPDVVVITAVAPEHMEYFGTLEAVAEEELTPLSYAKRALVNTDDVAAEYLADKKYVSYGLDAGATYHAGGKHTKALKGQKIAFRLQNHHFTLTLPVLGAQGAKVALAAAATAHMLGLSESEIELGVTEVTAFAGRMQILSGIKGSTLIDDTYNSSPLAAKAALDVLYGGKAPQRIAILGSMNELGAYSEQAHREVGEYCDPAKLTWIVTIGREAQKYLAPVARKRGCKVKTFLDPHKAGLFVQKQLKQGAVVLAKGSQNGVFAEEALKPLLANKEDENKLVRQSAYWTNAKKRQFH